MDAAEAILGKHIHDFTKEANAKASILKDDIIHGLLEGHDVSDLVKDLRWELKRIADLEGFPKVNIVCSDMPPNVLLMAFGSNNTYSALLKNGSVESGTVIYDRRTMKGESCSTPTSSSTSENPPLRRRSKRRTGE